jgi:hypothetical protein
MGEDGRISKILQVIDGKKRRAVGRDPPPAADRVNSWRGRRESDRARASFQPIGLCTADVKKQISNG